MAALRTVGVVLFPGFELLDVFGPVEAFAHRLLHDHFRVVTVAERPGPVESAQGQRAVADHGFADCPRLDLLLVPGGMGTRREVDNATLAYVASVTDEQLLDVIHIRSWVGWEDHVPRWQALIHQAFHQHQHRGELALVLTTLGRSPGEIDIFDYFDEVRESQGAG